MYEADLPSLVPQEELAYIPKEEYRKMYESGLKRFAALSRIKTGTNLVFNVPGHGVIGVGVVTKEYKEGTIGPSPSGFGAMSQSTPTCRENESNLVVEGIRLGCYKSLLKVGSVGIIATSAINLQPDNKGRQLMAALLVVSH